MTIEIQVARKLSMHSTPDDLSVHFDLYVTLARGNGHSSKEPPRNTSSDKSKKVKKLLLLWRDVGLVVFLILRDF